MFFQRRFSRSARLIVVAATAATMASGLTGTTAAHATTGSPPTNASWSTDVTSPQITQTITFFGSASDPDNDISTYAWNWGDGNSDPAGPSDTAQHIYALAGTYVVRLTVADATAQTTTYENTIVVRNNWAPAAVSGSPDDFAATYPRAGVSETFDFSGYDPEAPSVNNLTWDVNWGDGTTHGNALAIGTAQVSHSWTTPGTYVITYSATDADGTSGPSSNRTTFGIPIVVTVATDPAPVNVQWGTDLGTSVINQAVTFTGYAQDPDGGSNANYEWDFNGDGVYESQSADDAGNPGTSQIMHTFTQPGTYAVGLRVTDSDGGASSTYVYTFVVTSAADGPYGYLYTDYTYYNGYSVKAGQADNFYGQLYDPSATLTATHYVFHWGDGTADTSTSSGTTQHTYAAAGIYHPSVTITMSNSATVVAQFSSYVFVNNQNPYGTYIYEALQVVDNVPPAYAYADVNNNTGCLHASASLGFTLSGYDPDGGHISTFDVDWNGDGTFDSTGIAASNDQATVNHTYTVDGVYPVVVRAHDNDSPSKQLTDVYNTQTVTITPDNCAPYPYATFTPSNPRTNKAITFNASYSYDLDGTIASYAWDFNQDGTYEATGVQAQHTYTTDGTHYYTLKVTDNQGGVGYQTFAVNTHPLPNDPPVFYNLYISDTSPTTADIVYFDASAYDDDGTVVQYQWDWTCDHVIDQTTSSSSNSHVYATAGTFHPCVTVVDDDGGTASSSPGQTYTITVTAAVPTATISWSPDEPHPATTIGFTAFASSPNGAVNQYTWHWGDGTADTVTTNPNANHAYATAGSFPVTVTVRDTTNATGTGPAQNVTVMTNWPPHAFFTASPQCATQNTSVTFDGSGTTDSDSTVASYHWDFGDSATSITNGATTTHSYANPGTYDATLVAVDGGGASSTAYHRTITIQNGNCPPQDVYFTYTPNSLPSGSPISFTGHAVDPDGTISSYTWSWGDGSSDTVSPTSGGSITQHTYANPGLYTVQVIARDNLGLAGVAYVRQLQIGVDTTAPTVTLTTPTDGAVTNDTTPTYAGTAGDDVNDSTSVTVKIYSGSTVSGSPVQTRVATRSGTSWTIDGSPALAAGTYTAQAQQSDAANNTGFSAPHTFVIDTTAPTVTLTSPANGSSTNDTTPTYAGTAGNLTGDSTSVTVNIYSGSTVSGSPVQSRVATRSGTSWTVDGLVALAEGTYTAQAVQTDAAGNSGTSAAHTFVVDTTAPAVTLTNPADGSRTNDTTPTYSGTAGNLTGDSTSVTVNIYSGSTVSGSPVQSRVATRSGTSWTIDGSPALAAGTYTAQATQTDAAGNTGTSTPHTFVIDTTAPTVTLTSPANNASNVSGTPAFNGVGGLATGDSPTVTVNVYSGNNTSGQLLESLVTTRDAGTGAYSISANPALQDGTYTAQTVQTDSAGNQGTSTANTFTVNGPPVVTLTTPTAGAVLSDNTPTLGGGRGTAQGDLATVTLRIYAGTTATGTPVVVLTDTNSGSTWQITSTTLSDGTYTAQASQSDATSTGTSAAVTFRIDTAAPAPSITAPSNGAVTNDTTPTVSGTGGLATGDASTVTVKIYSGGTATGTPIQIVTPALSGAGTWTFDAAALADGTYTAQATQSDNAAPANVGTSAAVTWTVDTTPATVTVESSQNPVPFNLQPVTYTVTVSGSRGTPSGNVTLTVNGTSLGSPTALSGGTAMFQDITRQPGTYSVVASYAGGPNYNPATSSTLSQVVNAVAPQAPTGLSATATQTSLTVSFTPGGTGGATTTYVATAVPTGGGTAISSGSGTGSPLTISGLTPSTSYSVTVTATNSVGSTSSSAITASTLAPLPPGAPTGVSAAPSTSSFVVSFTPGANSSAGTTFTVTATPTAGGTTVTATGNGSPITVAGLPSGTSYQITVTATNNGGTATSSPAVTASTAPADAQNVDTGSTGGDGTATATSTSNFGQSVSAHMTGDGTVTTGWYNGPPLGSPGLLNGLSFFDVYVTPSSGGTPPSQVVLNVCNIPHGATLKWLNAANVYETVSAGMVVNGACVAVTLTATTTPRVSDLKGTVFAVTDTTAPSVALGKPASTTSLAKAIAVAWSGTDSGGSGLTSYDVWFKRAGWNTALGALTSWKTGVTSTSGTFTGAPGYKYCFYVRARDAAGNLSGWSGPKCTALPLDDRVLAASSGWSKITGKQFYLNTAMQTKANGKTLTRKGAIAGRAVLVVAKGKGFGTLVVLYNGKVVKSISLSATKAIAHVLITLPNVRKANTTIVIKSTSTHPVQVDGLLLARV